MRKWQAILSILVQLMIIAERTFGAGAGPKKKELVLAVLNVILSAIGIFLPEEKKEDYDRILPHLSGIIDHLASILFPKS